MTPFFTLAATLLLSYLPPEQHRHDQLTAMQAAFSRFSGGGADGSIDRQELPDFVRFVVTAMNSQAVPPEQAIARSTELTQRLMGHLPPGAARSTSRSRSSTTSATSSTRPARS